MNDKISSEEEFATGGVVSSGGPLFIAPLTSGCDITYGNAAMVLKPGEKLVVSLPADASPDQLAAFAEHLRSYLGDRVVVMAGAEQIAAVPTSTRRRRQAVTDPQQFRKKPVVIEAMDWDGTASGATPIIDWVLSGGGTARFHEPDSLGDGLEEWRAAHRLHIDTLEGTMQASPGDWIIRGVKGEFYPCKPDIFDATYERDLGESS